MTGGANVAPGSPSASGDARVGSGEHREQQGQVVDVAGHRPGDPERLPLVLRRPRRHPARGSAAARTPRRTTPGCAGEPPMSEPSASGTMPEASAHAAPPLDPPALRVGSTGLRVVPKIVLNVWLPAANSGTFVFPIGTAPARRIRSTTSSSRSGTLSASSGEPYVVRHPATSWVSLNAHGSPCSGPRSSYGVRSASLAPSRARSSSRETIALSSGLRSAIRARWRSISSEQEISRRLSAASISRAVESTVRSVIAGFRSFLPLGGVATSERPGYPVDRVSPHLTAAARTARRRRRPAGPGRHRRRCP